MILFDYFASKPLPPAFEYAMDDGTPTFVRHLHPEDAQRLRDGFQGLSKLSRRRKFGLEETLQEDLIRKLTEADGTHTIAWGAANLTRLDEPGIGVARYFRLENEPDAADVAIVVTDDYMNKGAGVLLHGCLHLSAYEAGLRHFYYDVVADNERFIRHLKALGAEYVGRAMNVTRLKCPVYGRAWDVPHIKPNGRRFAQVLRRLNQVSESTRETDQMDEHIVVP